MVDRNAAIGKRLNRKNKLAALHCGECQPLDAPALDKLAFVVLEGGMTAFGDMPCILPMHSCSARWR